MTRFLWGMFMFLLCTLGLSLHVFEIRNDVPRDWFDWVLMVGCFLGSVMGVNHIHKSFEK